MQQTINPFPVVLIDVPFSLLVRECRESWRECVGPEPWVYRAVRPLSGCLGGVWVALVGTIRYACCVSPRMYRPWNYGQMSLTRVSPLVWRRVPSRIVQSHRLAAAQSGLND
eukprot:6873412-Prymnesium_polylepis.1